jgi:hypothetical protein
MRTTIDLPDDLYRTLKARAALSGVTLRQLIGQLIEQGLRQPGRVPTVDSAWGQPPVIVAPRGKPIASLTTEERHRLEEDDDAARSRTRPGQG